MAMTLKRKQKKVGNRISSRQLIINHEIGQRSPGSRCAAKHMTFLTSQHGCMLLHPRWKIHPHSTNSLPVYNMFTVSISCPFFSIFRLRIYVHVSECNTPYSKCRDHCNTTQLSAMRPKLYIVVLSKLPARKHNKPVYTQQQMMRTDSISSIMWMFV